MILEMVSKVSGLSQWGLSAFSNTASYRYKIYKIPKKKGGERVVEHPSKEVKFLQRILIDMLFSKMDVHQTATAYVKGKGIVDNVSPHATSNYLAKFDFMDFFPSITSENIKTMLRRNLTPKGINLPEYDLDFITKICCRKGRLVIGAPSSPIISNLVMFPFDENFDSLMKEKNITYTRYADDICLSSNIPNSLQSCEDDIRTIVKNYTDLKLQINYQKTIQTSKKHKRFVTGIVISSESRLSVGRDRKKILRAKVHRAVLGLLSSAQLKSLAGEIAYIDSIEPGYYHLLINKNGNGALKGLLDQAQNE